MSHNVTTCHLKQLAPGMSVCMHGGKASPVAALQDLHPCGVYITHLGVTGSML